MIDKSRALALLGSGLGPTEVGTTLGCDPSYISQLLMDEDFKREVMVQRMAALQQSTARDQRIDALEDDFIQKVADMLPFVVKPREVLQCFAVLNGAKRRGARAEGASINVEQKIVAIVLPPVAREQFLPKTNANGEVVQVGEQVTVTMPLQHLLKDRLQQRPAGKTYDNAAREETASSGAGAKTAASGS